MPHLQFELQFTQIQRCPWRYTHGGDLHWRTPVDVRVRRAGDFNPRVFRVKLIPIAGILMCVLSEPFGETVVLGRSYRSSFIKRGYELARPS